MADFEKKEIFGALYKPAAKMIPQPITAKPKEATIKVSAPKAPAVSKIAVGNKVRFLGGNVFLSASTSTVVAVKKEGLCEVVRIHNGVHKYRCLSIDNSGIDGWVDEASIVKI